MTHQNSWQLTDLMFPLKSKWKDNVLPTKVWLFRGQIATNWVSDIEAHVKVAQKNKEQICVTHEGEVDLGHHYKSESSWFYQKWAL